MNKRIVKCDFISEESIRPSLSNRQILIYNGSAFVLS